MQAKQLSEVDAKAEVQRLNRIKIASKDDIDSGLKVFDKILEVNSAVRTKYIEQDEEKFKIPAMKSLDAKNPNLHLQQELDTQTNIITTSTKELMKLQGIQDKSKEDREKEMTLPTVIASAQEREKELRSLVVTEQKLIAQERKAEFMFSDIAKEAFGSAISTDKAQGVGVARGQAENQAMEGFKLLSSPLSKLANEFVDLYSYVNQWPTRQEALKSNVSALESALQNTTNRRSDMVEERLMKLNSNIYDAQNHLDKTAKKIAKFSGDLRDSIKVFKKEFEALDKAIVDAAKDPGKFKVTQEQKLRFMELNTLLSASRQLQKIVDGMKISEDKTLAKTPSTLSSSVASPKPSIVAQSKQSLSSTLPSSHLHPPILRAEREGHMHGPSTAKTSADSQALQPPQPNSPSRTKP